MEASDDGLGKIMVLENDEISVFVAAYEPGAIHRAHRDAQSRISILLRGDFVEETAARSVIAEPGDVLFKSKTVVHENRFGDEGAIVASIALKDDHPLSDAFEDLWSLQRSRPVLRDAFTMFEAAFANCRESVAASLAALLSYAFEPTPAQRTPPVWLRRLKDDLQVAGFSQINIKDYATSAGVHPAHVSRLFRSCYGISITEYAQFHAVRRALRYIAAPDQCLNHIALAAGFFDQSHMNRVFTQRLGCTPGEMRRLASNAASLAHN